MDSELYMQQLSKMDRPIPGMSLTNDPENPAPYERPPSITNVHEASNYMFDALTQDDETYEALMTGLSRQVPLMSLVEVILFQEFENGTFNPDLMMMMVEPTAYMLLALAERLGIDVVVDADDDDEEEVFGVKIKEEKLDKLVETAKSKGSIPAGFLSDEQLEKMSALPAIPSLLQKNQIEKEPSAQENVEESKEDMTQQPSLMAATEGQ